MQISILQNVLGRWFPRTERAGAVGMSMAGFHLGIVMGLLASPLLIASFGVDMPFLTFGLVGAVWLFFWLSFVTTSPETHPNISDTELQCIQQQNVFFAKSESVPSTSSKSALPFGLLLSKLPSWAILVANFMNNWVRQGNFLINKM
jgi:MFS family permease